MEEMGVGVHSRALMAKAWSSEQGTSETGCQDLETCESGTGDSRKEPRRGPIIFAMILECVVRRCEEKWAANGWGFWLDGTRWVSASYADDIFLISARKRDLEAMIRDITTELETVGLGIGANKTHWSSYPAKPGQTLHVGTEQIQWEQVLTFVGMALDLSGSSWAAVRYRIESRRKWSPIFRSKSVSGKRKLDLMINFCVGKRIVGRRFVDTDESNENCDRQLECTYSEHDTGGSRGVQKRRWISGGEDSIELDTRY